MSKLFKVLGFLAIPPDKKPKVAGIYHYLDFTVSGELGPLYVKTEPILVPGSTTPLLRARLKPSSQFRARRAERDPNFILAPLLTMIDLNQQVICEDRDDVYILDARRLQQYQISIKNIAWEIIQEELNRSKQ